MTAVPLDRSTRHPAPGATARIRALAAAETRLLLRNRAAVVNSVLSPLLVVVGLQALGGNGGTGTGVGLVAMMIGITLVLTTYYNLVTTFVARRESLVLQWMRTGELTDAEIVVGTAVPTILVSWVQIAVVAVGAVATGEWSAPVDVALPLLATIAGGVLMVLMAAVSTSFTRTAESAQLTTMPFVVVATTLSGMVVPLTLFPEQLAWAARFLPLSPVVELVQLGLGGRAWNGTAVDLAGAWAHAPLPLAVLAGWLLVGAVVARRVFRWAPRR